MVKIICDNMYVKYYQFNTEDKFNTFISNHIKIKKLIFEQKSYELWHCYVGYNSLNDDELFIIGFDSNSYIDNLGLNFLYWSQNNLIVLDNGNEFFIINNDIKIVARYNIITPIIGFYITESGNLLVLEEVAMYLISKDGKLLKSEHFYELLVDYYINKNNLYIKTGESNIHKIIEL